MSYDGSFQQNKKPPTDPHPVWRGLGCLLMVLVPLFSYGLADILVKSSTLRKVIPAELRQPLPMPFDMPVGIPVPTPGGLIFTVALIIILFALFTVMYSLVVRPEKSEFDVEPPKRPKNMRKSR